MTPVYLIGVDGSSCCNRALDYVGERAQSNSGKVIVVHVIEWSPYSFSTAEENERRHQRREEELARAHEQIVDPLVEKLRERGAQAEGLVAHGHVAQTLVRLAAKHDATSIIVGRKGSSRIAQLFGSVASHVVQIADRPVTVVP